MLQVMSPLVFEATSQKVNFRRPPLLERVESTPSLDTRGRKYDVSSRFVLRLAPPSLFVDLLGVETNAGVHADLPAPEVQGHHGVREARQGESVETVA